MEINWIKTFYIAQENNYFDYRNGWTRGHIKCWRVLTKGLDVGVNHDDEVDLWQDKKKLIYYILAQANTEVLGKRIFNLPVI